MTDDRFFFPTSFAQQRLWFLDQLEPHSPLYNVPRAMRLYGTLNVEALQRALNALVARHETLRTTFAIVDGNPMQVIAEEQTMVLSVLDLQSWPEGEREAEVVRRVTAEAQRPFDLADGPLLRATLLRSKAEEHILLLTMHHIISDGWSMGVLLREFGILYTAHCNGQPSLLPPLPIQYADYTVWQRQWLQGEELAKQVDYWQRQLSGVSPLLELPTDHPRPAVQTYRGTRYHFLFTRSLADRLTALSQQEGVTLFMLLLAAFQVLLQRYTRQEDIVVGSPIAGRTRAELEGLIGFFVNTLVLRTDCSGNPTFREFLRRVREVALGAYAHQDLPFERLVEEVQPERTLSHSPLFQVVFALQNAPTHTLELAGLTISPVEIDTGTAKFDLSLFLREEEDGLRGTLEYNTDLFEAATVIRMREHYQTLLAGIVANPDGRIGTLPLLAETERYQLLVEWNTTTTDYPQDQCIPQLFEAQVERTPDALAVVFERQQVTYRELNRRANQLAHYLRKLGVGPEVLVGLCVERSLEMVVGLLGILKAGGAYVPLDPTYPQERLAFMLEDAQVKVLLTQEHLKAKLPQHTATVLSLDTDWTFIAQEGNANPICEATADNLAYVIYTSGSTGQPKGVAVPHRAVNRLVINTNYIQIKPHDVVAQISNCSFDAATFEVWGALLHGARLVVIPSQIVLSPQSFTAHLTQHKISTLFITTALFNQMVQSMPTVFRQLHHVLFGGEAVDPRWVKEVLHAGPPKRLLHVYGPTETTTFASWHEVRHVAEEAVTIPIGRPLANTQIYLLDQHLQPVPVGVPGELYIGGPGLARGYLNQPELTTAKFISHPLSTEPRARLYKTGDLARYLPDGNIEFLGRLDHQVKLRGFRIELGEVETTLAQHPAVREVVVTVREDTPGDKRLVAYVVRAQEQFPSPSELRRFLQTKLPEYMVPAAFLVLDALPLNPNGKVDRQALPPPSQAATELERPFVAPRDRLEYQLAKLWEKILGIQMVSVNDNFFDLGGHSLLAVRLLAQIEKISGKDLALVTIFQAPTVEQMAAVLRQHGWSTPQSLLLPFQAGGFQPPFFCVHGYGELWRYVGSDQPFYAFHPHGLDGYRAPATVEEMAADYLKEVQALQTEGPYFLGGFSFGGLIVFEMAQQLRKQGKEVALLVLFDPTKPSNGTPFSAMNPSQRVKWLARKITHKICRLYLSLGRRLPPPLRLSYFLGVARQAAQKYRPQMYWGRTLLFKTKTLPFDPRFDWNHLVTGGVEAHEILGTHLDIFREPHVQSWAEYFVDALRQAQVLAIDTHRAAVVGGSCPPPPCRR